MQDEDNSVNEDNGFYFVKVEVCESTESSSAFDFEVSERQRLSIYQEILQSYDESKIDSKNLKEAKEKIFRC